MVLFPTLAYKIDMVCTPSHGQGHFHEWISGLHGEEGRLQWMKTNIITLRRGTQKYGLPVKGQKFFSLNIKDTFDWGRKQEEASGDKLQMRGYKSGLPTE